MLIFHGEAGEAAFAGNLVRGKCEWNQIDIGVGRDVIGSAVMAIVLVEPPTVAEAENQIGMKEAEDFISGGAAENFLMAGIVNDETELSKDKSEEGGNDEFHPGAAKDSYEREGADKHDEIDNYFSDVIQRLLCEEAALPDNGLQVAKFVASRR